MFKIHILSMLTRKSFFSPLFPLPRCVARPYVCDVIVRCAVDACARHVCAWQPRVQRGSESPQRRGSFLVVDENSVWPNIDVESLEESQKQRRASMSMRRPSLAEVIPDWPTLNHPTKVEKVVSRSSLALLLNSRLAPLHSVS